MKPTLEQLVILILTLVVLFFAITMMLIFFGASEESSEISCASAVALRNKALTVSPNWQSELVGCETKPFDHTGETEEKIRSSLVKETISCFASFGGLLDIELLTDQDVLCHVCSIHEKDDGGEVTGVAKELQEKVVVNFGKLDTVDDEQLAIPIIGERLPENPDDVLDFSGPLAIIYVQDRTENHNLFTQITDSGAGQAFIAGGSAVAVAFVTRNPTLTVKAAGASYSIARMIGPDTDTVSGTVIRPWDKKTIDELGCTTITAE